MNLQQILNVPPNDAYIFRDEGHIQRFKGNKVGTSDCNQYIPLVNLTAHELLDIEGTRVLEYRTPTLLSKYQNNAYSQYRQVSIALLNSNNLIAFKYLLGGIPQYVFLAKGVLMSEEGEILMCLGLSSEYLLSTTMDVIRLSPNVDKCIIFMSNEYCTNPKYKNLKKKLDALYVGPCVELGMDIIQTNSIDKWLFKNNFTGTKFKNVMQQQKYLKEELPEIMLNNL